ncbi:hypothetical protein [Caulobacter sp. CCUG 60055]|uniref:hypothetical protein n=1 Tax=Caulobacter sp. CCUG 60055 TaxID=2100090 RepID=UPI001FA7A5E1|nr:hypothetical protein [Caulobacter sp. CCUG 60055]
MPRTVLFDRPALAALSAAAGLCLAAAAQAAAPPPATAAVPAAKPKGPGFNAAAAAYKA